MWVIYTNQGDVFFSFPVRINTSKTFQELIFQELPNFPSIICYLDSRCDRKNNVRIALNCGEKNSTKSAHPLAVNAAIAIQFCKFSRIKLWQFSLHSVTLYYLDYYYYLIIHSMGNLLEKLR